MMNLKVIGTGCEDCDRLYENTKQAIAQLGIAPSLMKDGKLIISGQVVSSDKIVKLLQK